MVIELIGLPGAGKSTLSRLIAERLTAAGHRVDEATYVRDHRLSGPRRVVEKLALALACLGAQPRRSAELAFRVARTRQATLADWGTSVFNFLYVSALHRRRRGDGVLLLDQGIAQALWSIGFAAKREDWAEIVARRDRAPAPWPDLVVVVRASPAVILERLRQRSKQASRLEKELGRSGSALERCAARLQAVLHLLRRDGVPLVEVSSEGMADPAAEVERVMAAVARYHPGSPCPAGPSEPARARPASTP